jgi:hypothetical protein
MPFLHSGPFCRLLGSVCPLSASLATLFLSNPWRPFFPFRGAWLGWRIISPWEVNFCRGPLSPWVRFSAVGWALQLLFGSISVLQYCDISHRGLFPRERLIIRYGALIYSSGLHIFLNMPLKFVSRHPSWLSSPWERLYICILPPLWSSGQSSWLHNGDELCFLWGTNWIYICYVEERRSPLQSSGQSSWLQIQKFGFESLHYQIFWEVVWSEVHPASWVQLRSYLEEKIAAPV